MRRSRGDVGVVLTRFPNSRSVPEFSTPYPYRGLIRPPTVNGGRSCISSSRGRITGRRLGRRVCRRRERVDTQA